MSKHTSKAHQIVTLSNTFFKASYIATKDDLPIKEVAKLLNTTKEELENWSARDISRGLDALIEKEVLEKKRP